jgi:multidrug efflux pump subunit AcrB
MFLVHNWLPSGTDIRRTTHDLSSLEKYILQNEHVKSVATYIGSGAPRFILTFAPEETSDKAYGLLLVTVDDYKVIDSLVPEFRDYINDSYPDAYPVLRKFALGPGSDYDIEARFSGPDPRILRQLAGKAEAIMRDFPYSARVWDDWRPPVKVIRPVFDEVKAKQAGISRPMLAEALETAFSGTTVGVYREADKILPIISRLPDDERLDVGNIVNIQVYSPVLKKSIPISQVVSGFETVSEDSLRMRFNRKLTIRARGNI